MSKYDLLSKGLIKAALLLDSRFDYVVNDKSKSIKGGAQDSNTVILTGLCRDLGQKKKVQIQIFINVNQASGSSIASRSLIEEDLYEENHWSADSLESVPDVSMESLRAAIAKIGGAWDGV